MSMGQTRTVEARLYAIDETVKRLGLSRSQVYAEIRAGHLRSVMVGKRRLISEAALFDYIDDLEANAGA